MGKFNIINKKLNKINQYFLQDNDICKLLSNTENINNDIRKKLINQNIYIGNFIPDSQQTTESIISTHVPEIIINRENPEFIDGVLVVEVMVHRDLIQTDLGNRLFLLCDLIDKNLSDNRKLGIGGADFIEAKEWIPAPGYSAYQIVYRLINWKVEENE